MNDLSVANADMQSEVNRGVIQQLWAGLIAGRDEQVKDAYDRKAVIRVPQTGKRIAGRTNIASRGLLEPGEKLVKVNCIVGDGDIWVSECEILRRDQTMLLVTVSVLHDGKILRETRYRLSMQD
jgi:hypothetical protein